MDRITKQARSENMRRIRSKDMKPEMAVRKLVYSLGYRYRLHKKELPGKPDLVFTSKRKVIFVHGCFWHQHNAKNCSIKRKPKTNTDYWLSKLQRNTQRDLKNQKALKRTGWKVLTIWECELKNKNKVELKLNKFLQSG